MLQIKEIRKKYVTGDLIQTALDGVSVNLRDSEFVAVLGQSGSGKTTFLNVIGGLDRYDSGDLIINGISTKKYKDRDWDSYRNHTVGFVFQSYNLIPHQSVLSNVELALTISGISSGERKKRAKEALEKVGLGDQLHKKPNQMSGGQMQRVAIARALVNDPDILLADEPTGALDTETSIQVMNLLKEVAKERLVVMVTHNPELAEEYATRIIKLKDGEIISDSDEYIIDEKNIVEAKHQNMGKASMSLKTAIALSFNNLKTKKARTILTAFAGSIGIIGIALIMSLSNGVNTYIEDIQKSTMISYPIAIDAQSIDLSSIIGAAPNSQNAGDVEHGLDGIYSNTIDLKMASAMTMSIAENNLTAFKKYLENSENEINNYVGENGIVYSYDTKFDVYSYDEDGYIVNSDGSNLTENSSQEMLATMVGGPPAPIMKTSSQNGFEELMPGTGDQIISSAVTDTYDVLEGKWPEKYDEVVLVLDSKNELTATNLYKLGLLPSAEYKEIMKKIENGEEIETQSHKFDYKDILNRSLYMVIESDKYVKNENGTFDVLEESQDNLKNIIEKSLELKVVGVVKPIEDSDNTLIKSPIGYTKALTDYIIDYTNNSEVVKAQMNSKDINVLNGMKFAPGDDATKIEDTKKYLENLGVSDKANLFKVILQSSGNSPEMMGQMMNISESEMAASLDNYLLNPEDKVLLSIYDNYISPGNYDDNMANFGVVSVDAPSSINIYADSFEDKEAISNYIKEYNKTASEADQITYTDYVALLMSSVTTIINVISYVLIAFVGVSLVVSSIMIGIITYISVLERTKEIGILRAIGASKSNISQVFNAETAIIGLFSGLIGIGITLLALIPANAIIRSIIGTNDVKASLPPTTAIILILLSLVLTIIGGLIPSKKAATKDPVTALRSE